MQTTFYDVLVLGSGNFGTCLAVHLAHLGHRVKIWSRSHDVCRSINENHTNPKYLSSIVLPKSLKAINVLTRDVVASCPVILLAIPTQSLRDVLTPIGDWITPDHLLISAAKGIEVGSLKFPTQVVEDICGKEIAENEAVLSGPSFAIEVALGQPTGVSMASKNLERAKLAQEIFHSPRFRVYTSQDTVGLSTAGAFKNIFALASGACTGLGFEQNSRAALITRSLAEMTRVGVALGANPLTFKGLGGVGDLFLTCSSEKSRNFTVGYLLGKGQTLDEVLKSLGSVAEGVMTARSGYSLGQKLGVEIPITTQIYQVLYEGKPLKQAVGELVNRDAIAENE